MSRKGKGKGIADAIGAGLSDQIAAMVDGGGVSRATLLRPILPIEEWASDSYYCGHLASAPPSIRDRVIAGGQEGISKVLMGGAIGTFKTTVALYLALYEAYKCACWSDPAQAYGQKPGEALVFLFVSRDYEKAKEVPYGRFIQLVNEASFFRDHFKPVIQKEQMLFPNNIIVMPVATTEENVISYTVVFFYMDESEHMKVTSDSRLARGLSKEYDQAEEVAGEGLRRMMSRMFDGEKLRGQQVFTSSPKFPDSYLQRQIRRAKEHNDKYTFTSEMTLWDAWRGFNDPVTGRPKFSDEMTPWGGFSVEIGDDTFLSRILEDGEEPRRGALVRRVPIELRSQFDPKLGGDLEEAIRDLIGLPLRSTDPLITDRAGLVECIRVVDPAHHRPASEPACECDTCVGAALPSRSEETYLENVDVELIVERLCRMDKDGILRPRMRPDAPRFVHIDGSFDTTGGDATGIVMLHPFGTKVQKKLGSDGRETFVEEVQTYVDLTLRVRRHPASPKLEWERLSMLLLHLRDRLGFNIVMLSMDTYQSTYFLQTMASKGFLTNDKMSVDKDVRPYLMLRDAISEKRVSIGHHEFLIRELLGLEFNRRYRRIDHPKHGSKDVSDALCGAHFLATKHFSEYAGWDAEAIAITDWDVEQHGALPPDMVAGATSELADVEPADATGFDGISGRIDGWEGRIMGGIRE